MLNNTGNYLRTLLHTKKKNITSNSFSEYFKAINNPDDQFFQSDEDIIYFNERFLNTEIQVVRIK